MGQKELYQQRLRELEVSYRPGVDARKVISRVTLINIIGPSGVGKSSLNHQITQLDPRFSVPLGFTTRPPRPNESLKQYRHIPDTAAGWKSLLAKADSGDLVQYAIHTTSGMIYGTEPQDYKTEYSVLDMQYQFVEKSHELGFMTVKDIALATTPDDYDKQLDKQRVLIGDAADMELRHQEGILCLRWCLRQNDKISWVNNRYGELEKVAAEIIDIATGHLQSDPASRQLGEQLLKRLEQP